MQIVQIFTTNKSLPRRIELTRMATRKTRAKQCKMLNNYLKQLNGGAVSCALKSNNKMFTVYFLANLLPNAAAT